MPAGRRPSARQAESSRRVGTTAGILIYVLTALGAAAVYLLMPQGRRASRRAGAVLAVAALAGLMILVGSEVVFPGGYFYFVILSSIALFGGVRVITHSKPVYSAVYFVLVVLASAGLLLMLRAEFLAVALVMIYAGAIMVTYVFVIMLAQQTGMPAHDATSREPLAAVAVGFLLTACVTGLSLERAAPSKPATANRAVALNDVEASPLAEPSAELAADSSIEETGSNTLRVGEALLTRHVLAFELAGVLLLVAMVGAIALVKRPLESEEAIGPLRAEPSAPGKIGREVEPF